MSGYLIATIDVKNPEAYKEYLSKVTNIVKKYGGEYLVRAGEYTVTEGKWDYFYLGNIRYHNHDVDIIWKKDWDTKKSGNQSKLCVWVDGKLAASSPSLNSKLLVKLQN